jgi:hypothetical protein
VNLINNFELPCRVSGKDTGQAGSETGTDHHMNVALLRLMIESKKRTNISQIVGGADDMNPLPNKSFGKMCLRTSGTSQHDNIDIKWIVKRPRIDAGSIAKTLRDEFNAISTFIAEHNIDVIG